MQDRPINFRAHEVRAALAGTKTQHRTVLPIAKYAEYLAGYSTAGKLHEYSPARLGLEFVSDRHGLWHPEQNPSGRSAWYVPIPFFPGQRLWVREAFNLFQYSQDGDEAWPVDQMPTADEFREANEEAYRFSQSFHYAATPDSEAWRGETRWRSPVVMPRWASRLTLIVESVKIERLQDMEGQHPSESDAIAEGVNSIHHGDGEYYYSAFRAEPHPENWIDPTDAFKELWDGINANRPGCAWDDNPWVAAIRFRVVKANIDSSEVV